ncbi:hypothetical protein EAF00_012025 [Botryotinia globosa]|nr:hypothetical protein EAF00_012025 [Botryotinia globosa]
MSNFNDEGNGSGGPPPPQDPHAQDVDLPDHLFDLRNTISTLEILNAVAKREIELLTKNLHDSKEEGNKTRGQLNHNSFLRGQLDKRVLMMEDKATIDETAIATLKGKVKERDTAITILERKVEERDTAIAAFVSEHSALQIQYQELESTKTIELAHQFDEQAKVKNNAEKKINELKQQFQDLLTDHQQLKELDETKTQRFSAEEIRLQEQAAIDHNHIETLQRKIESKDEEISRLKTNYESLKELNNAKAKWANDEKFRFQEQANIHDNLIETLQSELKTDREEIARLKLRDCSWRKCAEALFARLDMEKSLWIKFPGVSTMSNWWNAQNKKDVESNWYKFLVARGIITHE